jgi:hypothetical protein
MELRRILAGILLAAIAAMATAADKRIALPGGESMVIGWHPAWVVADLEPGDPAGAVRFNGGNRVQWEVTIVPMPPHPSLTADSGNLRIYVRSMARDLENLGVTVDEEHRSLEGGQAKGFYVKAHDVKAAVAQSASKGKSKSLDYAHGYVGALSVGHA